MIEFTTLKETTPDRKFIACCLLVLVSPLCVFLIQCIVCAGLVIQPDIQRLGKSFEFPTIETRAKPYSALVASATHDNLLEENQNIDHVNVSVTHPEEYTGIVAVTVKRIYGTNRPFEAVQADFAQFFSTQSGWKRVQYTGGNPFWMIEAPYGAACVYLNKAEPEKLPSWLTTAEPTPFPKSWTKYQTLYQVIIDYLDFSKPTGCHFG